MIKRMFSRPENAKMYWKELMHQCTEIGFGSLGIVCLLYTSDAADERSSVDLGGRRIINKKTKVRT